jgi:hypothetical protein
MFDYFIKEFSERPIATLASLVGIIGFLISILNGKGETLPLFQLQTSKYFIFATCFGLGALFGLIHGQFGKSNFFLGLALAPVFVFVLAFAVGDVLFNYTPDNFLNARALLDYGTLSPAAKVAFMSFLLSHIVYFALYVTSHSKYQFGEMRNYWFREGQYYTLTIYGVAKLFALFVIYFLVFLLVPLAAFQAVAQ